MLSTHSDKHMRVHSTFLAGFDMDFTDSQVQDYKGGRLLGTAELLDDGELPMFSRSCCKARYLLGQEYSNTFEEEYILG